MENDCKLEREKDFYIKPKRNDSKSLEETRLHWPMSKRNDNNTYPHKKCCNEIFKRRN
jgi:hypothetical protein